MNSFIDMLGSFSIGCLSSWLVSNSFRKKSIKDNEKFIKSVTNKSGIEANEFVTMVEVLENKTVKKMCDEAYKKNDKKLLKKAFFLGSLVKMKNGEYLIGHKELTHYSPDYFKLYIDYCLATYISLNNSIGTVLLYTLLCEKIKLIRCES